MNIASILIRALGFAYLSGHIGMLKFRKKIANQIFSVIQQAHAGKQPQSNVFFTGKQTADWFRFPLSSEQINEIRSWDNITLYNVECDLLNIAGPSVINVLKKQKNYVAFLLSIHVVGYNGKELNSPKHEIKLEQMPVKASFASAGYGWEITAIEPLSSPVALEKKKFAFHKYAYWAAILALIIHEFFIR